jgi:6-phosphogluconolactonase
MKYTTFYFLSLLLFSACAKKEKQHFFVGTYTEKLGHVDGKGEGIYSCTLDDDGKIEIIHTAKGIANPSFVTVSPDKKYLYAVAENGGKPEQPFGSVVAYKINTDYSLLKINEVASYGVAPCHVSVDDKQRFVFVANYATGNIVSYKILENGALSDSIGTRQHVSSPQNSGAGKAWAHQVVPIGNDLFSADKGGDRIYGYHIEANGSLTEFQQVNTANGAGTRHLAFGKHLYAINENNSTIDVFNLNQSIQTPNSQTISTLPQGFSGKNYCADIHISPNGKFVYGSNRGHNSIAIFSVSETTGQLTLVGHESTRGEIPRNFMITPDGKKMLVANQNSSTIVVFDIDEKSGKLTFQASSAVPTPVCLGN